MDELEARFISSGTTCFNSEGRFIVVKVVPVRCKCGNLARVPCPCRGVTHGLPNNATCLAGEYETQKMMAME